MNGVPRNYTSEDLRQVGTVAIRRIIASLLEEYRDAPEQCIKSTTDNESGKLMLIADLSAERDFRRILRTTSHGVYSDIKLYGEESLGGSPVDLTNELGTCVLVDALDGSDLYERGMHNWCSAAVFFSPSNPPGKRIRACVVGLPDGSIYSATDELDGVLVGRSAKSPLTAVRGVSKVDKLSDASICFYGQKFNNFVVTANAARWHSIGKTQKTPRIYNLAGMPMLVKLIDKVSSLGSGIDIVFDSMGQQAHDVVPGAFLAMKAGAIVTDLGGNDIKNETLEEVMLKPNTSTLTYIVSANRSLANQFAGLYRSEN